MTFQSRPVFQDDPLLNLKAKLALGVIDKTGEKLRTNLKVGLGKPLDSV